MNISSPQRSRGRRRWGAPKVLVIAAALAAAVFAAPDLVHATDLEGSLSGYLPAGTYTIVGDIDVPAGQTLTLAPGVIFQFEDSFWAEYEFDVWGTLIAVGTEANPIIFQAAPGADEYNYIRIAGGSSHLSHCVIEHAGKVTALAEGGLWIDDCSPLIDNCTVRDGRWHGVYITGGSAQPTIRNTEVTSCANDGIDADGGAGMIVERCVIQANGTDGICIASGENVIVGCLITGNGEDGIDSHGITSYGATIINCTVGAHPSEGLSDESEYDLVNCIVVDGSVDAGSAAHCYMIGDLSFFCFVDAAGGDYRLADESPCRDAGSRFGAAAAWLPAADLDGNPRIHGIVDMGAYESTSAPDPGEGGAYFSKALLLPRMTQPVIRTPEEEFPVWVALLGTYGTGDVDVRLVDPFGAEHALLPLDVSTHDADPAGELGVRLHTTGIETVQEITVRVPAGTPADFYDIVIQIGPYTYQSTHAVRIVQAYPDDWSFIHITDPHVGYDAEAYTAAQRLRFFIREANFLNPDLVVVTGDICENQSLDNSYADSLLDALSLLRVPALILPGNHDHYNDDGSFNPYGYFRYFQELNRVKNCELRFGPARFYSFNTGQDMGVLELYRCRGAADAALDWAEARLAALDPATNQPVFFLTHGPNYDYFSWNTENTGRFRDMMNTYGVSLALAGHTHRMETFRNEGDNWFGRNDFDHEDDWGRDVAFPGFPLHVQTSSLGKEEHLPMPVTEGGGIDAQQAKQLLDLSVSEPHRRGLFGDDITFRVVRVEDGEVGFFTCDTDGDGFRNTEDAWLLGEIQFAVDRAPDGTVTSTVTNNHYETWRSVRHFIAGEAGTTYVAAGGEIVRHLPDGTVVVAVDSVGALSSTVVVLSPVVTGVAGGSETPRTFALAPNFPNPFNPATEIRFRLPENAHIRLSVHDITGRLVTVLTDGAHESGEFALTWDGRDGAGREAASGTYFARLTAGNFTATRKMVLVR